MAIKDMSKEECNEIILSQIRVGASMKRPMSDYNVATMIQAELELKGYLSYKPELMAVSAWLIHKKLEEEKLNKIIDELREQKVDLQNQVSRNKQLLIDVCEYFTSAEDKDMNDSELENWIVQVGLKLNLAVNNYK